MTAGRRDQLVALQTYTATQDGAGEETQTWGTVASEWAAVFYGRGDERRQAAMKQGTQPAVFQVLSNTTTRALTTKDRIVLDDYAWDIVGVAPDWPKRGLIELTAALTSELVDLSPPPSGLAGMLDFSVASNSALLAILEDA